MSIDGEGGDYTESNHAVRLVNLWEKLGFIPFAIHLALEVLHKGFCFDQDILYLVDKEGFDNYILM